MSKEINSKEINEVENNFKKAGIIIKKSLKTVGDIEEIMKNINKGLKEVK